ncbi:hypothetical protein NliqN6_6208 [Naganishia liquefaciens]|uniref:Cyclin N-terminal domain-containing protein n=1 Tax=Naganishia liquefaciens TaxID=104408 RepID=A0A8H3TY82_9TREE|nr:hypothetical protein NliqN6_6208 [Naganishia liquefaciens]
MTVDFNTLQAASNMTVPAESSSVAARRHSATSADPKEGRAGAQSTQASVEKRSSRKDPYYGHEETARMSSRFIRATFQCPDLPPATNPPTVQPTLAHFIAYALYRTRLPHFVTLVALVYLQRLKHRYPSAKGSSGHRLFISAFMIASKVVCDDTYSNQSWCIVGQKMFALKEMNQMEREMCGYLNWQLNASSEEVEDFERIVSGEHSNAAIFAKRQSALAAAAIPREVELIRPSPLSTSPTDSSQSAPLPAKRPKVVGRMESSVSVLPVSAGSANSTSQSIEPPHRVAGYVTSTSDAAPSASARSFQAYANGSGLTATRPNTRRAASSINTSSRKPQFTTGFEYAARQHVRRAGGLAGGSTPALDASSASASAIDSSDDLTSSTHSSPDSQMCQTPETTFVQPVNIIGTSGRLNRSCAPDGTKEPVYGPYSVYGCTDMPIPV